MRLLSEPRRKLEASIRMTIILTDKAREKLEEIANECGEPYSVRLKLLGSGCAGLSQDMVFSDQIGDLDDVVEFDGVQIIIDPFSRDLLGDFTLEYIDEVITQGFKWFATTLAPNQA